MGKSSQVRQRLCVKDTRPSAAMTLSNGRHYRCHWIEDSLTIHCDGNVSCGPDDAHAIRSFGNIHTQSIRAIYANPEWTRLRENLWAGQRCSNCNLYFETQDAGEQSKLADYPSILFIEPTSRCNIRCQQICCILNNDPTNIVRDEDYLSLVAFQRVIKEVRKNLRMVHFFNYGEPFMHKQAEDMLLYLRDLCPGALILTSTNGIPLAKMERAVKVVAAKLDHIWFTICGATQESYEKYQKKGRLKLALQGLQNIIDARHDNGKPHVTWRYVVFKWNDSFAEIDHVINLSREIGVDELKLHLTHVPHDARSFRLAPGTPGYYRYRRYIDEACNYTAPAPPDDGIYPLESLPGFGPAHWTTYKARLILAETNGSIHLSVSTNRLRSLLEEHHVFIQTPWQTYKTRLIKDCWADITLPVPDGFRAKGPFAVELLTDDYWFPAEDLGTADTRCLGMLLHKDVMATCEHGPADLTPLSRQEFPYDQAHNYPFPEAPHDGIYPFEDVADLGPAHWTTYRARLSLAETNGSIHLSVSTNRLRSLSEEHYVFLQTLWKAYKTRLIRNRWADITIPVPDRFRGNRSFTVELFTPDFWIPAEELGTADGRCLGMLLRGDVMTTIQHTPAELVLSLPGEIPMYKQ